MFTAQGQLSLTDDRTSESPKLSLDEPISATAQGQLSPSDNCELTLPQLPLDEPITKAPVLEDEALPAEHKEPVPELLENTADIATPSTPEPPPQPFCR
jgi:hypothetical protein